MAYRPFGLLWDDAPIDLSFLYAGERPAGRHGFLRVAGDVFEFEDGTPGRFWGTCFNSGANFPRHAESERLAERLEKFGVNLVPGPPNGLGVGDSEHLRDEPGRPP